MKRSEIGVAKFSEGYNCAQAVLFSFCDELNLDNDTALRIACGFGAGMGRKEEVCGAVSGGIMAIGLKYGRGEGEEQTATDLTYQKTRELMNGIAEEHGAYICRQLLNGCELTTPEGQKEFKEKDLRNKVCNPCIASVIQIVETIIA